MLLVFGAAWNMAGHGPCLNNVCGSAYCWPVCLLCSGAELEQLIPAGSFAGALRTAVLQGRRQMVYHMIQHEALQATEPSIMAGILGTAIYHRRCASTPLA